LVRQGGVDVPQVVSAVTRPRDDVGDPNHAPIARLCGFGLYRVAVPEMDRRNLLFMSGLGLLAAAIPAPLAGALPSGSRTPGLAPPPQVTTPQYLFHDEFDGPAGSAPDPAKWTIATAREVIKNPVFWDRPENMGQYRNDRRNVFLDGKSNLVIRATRENGKYFGGKLTGNWRGGIGLTWEARVKFDCLTLGCWPAWWLLNDDPVRGGEVDLVEWYGNGNWPSGTTVHARLDGTSFATQPFDVDSAWHVWRVTWTTSMAWSRTSRCRPTRWTTGRSTTRATSSHRCSTSRLGGPAGVTPVGVPTRPTCWSTGSGCGEAPHPAPAPTVRRRTPQE
jgi:Glycosyl hydrolases family 16